MRLFQILDELFKGSKEGQNIVVKGYFSKMSLDIIGEISFGYSFNSQNTELNRFLAVTIKSTSALSLTSCAILKFFPLMWCLPFGEKETAIRYLPEY